MRVLFKAGATAALCAACAVFVSLLVTRTNPAKEALLWNGRALGKGANPRAAATSPAKVRDGMTRIRLPIYGSVFLDDSGYRQATQFTGKLDDDRSLTSLQAAVRKRSEVGTEQLVGQLKQLESTAARTPKIVYDTCQLQVALALLQMYKGQFVEADRWIAEAQRTAANADLPADLGVNLRALRGVAAMRRGETENCVECVGPSSCVFPLAPEAQHAFPAGSRDAVRYFTEYLRDRPEDLGVRWLLNIAYMTLGEYPQKVPAVHFLELGPFRSKVNAGTFRNVASEAGLLTRGPNAAGGSIFDDLTGDGLPDLFTTAYDAESGASLFVNKGDGTFSDATADAGLDEQVLALNCSQADFDNDGRPDILLMRGGWELPYRQTLLRNVGNGRFADVTLESGLGDPIACQAGAWGDYDNDGLVDLYLVGEYRADAHDSRSAASVAEASADRRNLCRLYHNLGHGKFVDVAASAGVENGRFAKGAAWGDYDNDGDLDLFVSNNQSGCRLYRNNGRGQFEDVAPALGLDGLVFGFACWFWDYDNDGRLDLYVNDFAGTLQNAVEGFYGQEPRGPRLGRPHLFRNLGTEGFRDIAAQVGLDRPVLAMGANFGDLDNDGYLDMYHGTGAPAYAMLIPNILYKNVAGSRFEDITTSSGTGHLQKGHGVSFADYDNDGDQDLFIELGGAVPGDKAHNALFQNPGHGRHWLKVKLVGTRTNRAALGARIRADFVDQGTRRSIYRQVGGGSSFGGSTLVESLGLGAATHVETLTITWPASKTTQVYHDLRADRAIEITEGQDGTRALAAGERER